MGHAQSQVLDRQVADTDTDTGTDADTGIGTQRDVIIAGLITLVMLMGLMVTAAATAMMITSTAIPLASVMIAFSTVVSMVCSRSTVWMGGHSRSRRGYQKGLRPDCLISRVCRT